MNRVARFCEEFILYPIASFCEWALPNPWCELAFYILANLIIVALPVVSFMILIAWLLGLPL